MGAVNIAVRLDTAQFNAGIAAVNKGMSGIQASADRANKQLGKFNKAFDWAGRAFAFAAGGAVIVSAFNKLIDASAELQRSQNTVNKVFGEFAGQITEAANAAENLGLSSADYMQFAAQLGQVFQSLGSSQEYATTQSQWLIEAATDMATAFDHPEGVTGAVKALQALFRNEYDPAERFGIVLRQSAVNAKAAAEGIDVLTAKNRLLAKELQNIRGSRELAERQDNALLLRQQAAAKLTNTYAKLGDALTTPFAMLVDLVGNLADALESIPTPLVEAVLKVGAIVVGLKAATIVVGKFAKAIAAARAGLVGLASVRMAQMLAPLSVLPADLAKADAQAKKLKRTLGSIAATAATFGALFVFDKLNEQIDETVTRSSELTTQLMATNGAVLELQSANWQKNRRVQGIIKEINDVRDALDVLNVYNGNAFLSGWGSFFSSTLAQELAVSRQVVEETITSLDDLAQIDPSAALNGVFQLKTAMAAYGGRDKFEEEIVELEEIEQKIAAAAVQAGYGQNAFNDMALGASQLAEEVDTASAAVLGFTDGLTKLYGDVAAGANALDGLEEGLKGLGRVDKNLLPKDITDGEAATAVENLYKAVGDGQKQALAYGEKILRSTNDSNKANKVANKQWADYRKRLLDAAEAQGLQGKALKDFKKSLPKKGDLKVTLDTDDPKKAIESLEKQNRQLKNNIEKNKITPKIDPEPAKKQMKTTQSSWDDWSPINQQLTATVSVKAADENSRNILNKAGISIQNIPGMEDTVGVTAAGLAEIANMDSLAAMAATTGPSNNDREFYMDFIVRGSYDDNKVIEYLNDLANGWYQADKAAEKYLERLDRLVDKSSNLTQLNKDLNKLQRELENADKDDKKGIRKEIDKLEQKILSAGKATAKLAKQLGLLPNKAKFKGDVEQAEKLGKVLEKLSKKYRDAYDEALRAAQQYANDIYSAWSQIRDQVESSINGLFNIFGAGSEYVANLQKAVDLQEQENNLIADKAEAQEKVNELLADGRQYSWDPRVVEQWRSEVEAAQESVTDLQDRIDGLGQETEISLSTGDIAQIIKDEGAAATEFANALAQLTGKLSPEALSQLAALGPEMGMAYANALQDPTVLAAYNRQAAAVADIAEKAGLAAANAQLDAIKQGLSDAAKEQEKFFAKNPLEIKVDFKISKKTRKQLKKLGIKVPKAGGASAPTTVNINVTGHDLSDPDGVARTVREAWRRLDEREGRVDAFA